MPNKEDSIEQREMGTTVAEKMKSHTKCSCWMICPNGMAFCLDENCDWFYKML